MEDGERERKGCGAHSLRLDRLLARIVLRVRPTPPLQAILLALEVRGVGRVADGAVVPGGKGGVVRGGEEGAGALNVVERR